MSFAADRQRRPRRIASDEAHAWARNLRLGNPHAKFVLCMLTGYVNGEGACFVSIGHLAEDCELVENTVRRRLSFLEEVGAIARVPQWVDEAGRRNGEGRGRRTTDEIRLLLDADLDEIEAKARGNGDDQHHEADPARGEAPSPAPREGSNPADPSLGVHLPCTSVHPLMPEPEPEEIPPSPPRGAASAALSEAGRARFQEFKSSYPDGIVDLQAAETEYAGLTETDQVACNAATLVYAQRCQRRREKSMKAHLFVRKRAWNGLLAAPAEHGGPYDPAGETGRALIALMRIARTSLPRLGDGRLIYVRPITPQLLALAKAPEEVTIYRPGSQNFGAWREFLRAHLTTLPALAEIAAPWPWPPRKDGTPAATGPPVLASDQDLRDLADMG